MKPSYICSELELRYTQEDNSSVIQNWILSVVNITSVLTICAVSDPDQSFYKWSALSRELFTGCLAPFTT